MIYLKRFELLDDDNEFDALQQEKNAFLIMFIPLVYFLTGD